MYVDNSHVCKLEDLSTKKLELEKIIAEKPSNTEKIALEVV